MSDQTPPPPTPEFDQIVKGNVSIRKLKEKKYKITFSKIGKFLMYQVWNKDNVNNINDKRAVGYVTAKHWVDIFNLNNDELKKNGKPLFTPTTIMETVNEVAYAFVIEKAYLNSKDHVVFIVSTKDISLQQNTSKKLIDIPCGKHINMRFDIDYGMPSPTYQRYSNCVSYYTELIPTPWFPFLKELIIAESVKKVERECWDFYCKDADTPCR